jgi:hypothetical protein
MSSRGAACAAIGVLLLASAAARAAGPLGPERSPIRTSDYAVELAQGPVLAGTRVIGLAGAYVAIAEGVDGDTQNPAAPAVRVPWSFDHLDYDLGFGITFPTSIGEGDYFNSGRETDLSDHQAGFVFLNAAANLQLGRWGAGITLEYQRYSLSTDASGATPGLQQDELFAQFAVTHLLGARTVADGQLAIGVGLRAAGLFVRNENPTVGEARDLFATEAVGPEVGVLWRPNDWPIRVGAALRSALVTDVTKEDDESVTVVGDDFVIGDPADPNSIYLPHRITLPWDLNIGAAVQFGPRPFNPRWIDPEEQLERVRRFVRWRKLERRRARDARVSQGAPATAEDLEIERLDALDEAHEARAEIEVEQRLRARYAKMKRFHVLVSTSLLVTGGVKDAVGVESFLAREVQRSGQRTTYSPRLGVESEPIAHWLRVRAGSYWEPTRIARRPNGEPNTGRLHGTFGFDAKLFPWSVFGLFEEGTEWRASAAIDSANKYFGWSVSIGVWH